MRRFLRGQILGQVGDAAVQVVLAQLVVLEIVKGASPWSFVAILTTTIVPTVIAAPISSRIVDWQRTNLLVGLTLGGRATVALGAIAAVQYSYVNAGYLAWALALVCSRVGYALRSRLLAGITTSESFARADARSLLFGACALPVGALAAAAVSTVNAAAALVLAALCHLAGASTFTRLDASSLHGSQANAPLVSASAQSRRGAGVRSLVDHTWLAVTLAWGLRLLLGAQVVACALTTDRSMKLSAAGYAIAASADAMGSTAGAFIATRRTVASANRTVRFTAVIVAGLTLWIGSNVEAIAVVIALAIAGASGQLARIAAESAVQSRTPSDLVGRSIAAFDLGNHLAFGLGGIASAALWSSTGSLAVSIVIAGGYALIARRVAP